MGENLPIVDLGLNNGLTKEIDSHSYSVYALLSTGEVLAWGYGANGQLVYLFIIVIHFILNLKITREGETLKI